MGVTANYLMSLINKLDIMPIWEIMRENEREAGNEVIVPGSVDWLPAVDWDPTIVVSRRGRDVRLIAILAANPGNGAFRRLVAAIQEAGLVPVIIAPSLEMRETVRRWGWYRRYVGSGFEQEEQWRPRVKATTRQSGRA